MSSRPLRIAIVGATGAVGRVAMDLLEARRHPPDAVFLLASSRSAGKKLPYMGGELTVHETTHGSFAGTDVALISVSSEVSKDLAPAAVAAGTLVIDDSNAFRMDPDVPLVVPEVNAEDVEWHRGIASIPNCSTTPLVMALAALQKEAALTRVTVATYQSVSGTGAAAVRELEQQTADISAGREPVAEVYPHQIAFNALPQVDDFDSDGYTKEERKMTNETRKIMHLPDLPVSATCVRIPVPTSHSEAVHVEFDRPVEPARARSLLRDFPGVVVLDDPGANVYPMPHHCAGRDEVFVGRIRKDISHPNGLVFWVVCDNLRKGAALNALQIMDEVVRRNCLKPAPGAARGG
ncbi:MAG: aspartate-semialdehyde dehydrogenase [Chloroflexi bacterium]|nr:aspartate-semialdehyde dehydrogenase [Chloroflexota bacterium]